jgi:hypothetical protein
LAIFARNCDFLEEGFRAALSKLVAPEEGNRTTTAVKSAFLSKRDELFGEGAQCLGFAKSGSDLPVLDEARCEIAQERFAVCLVALEFDGFASVSHRKIG